MALGVVTECLSGGTTVKDVVFCVYDDENQKVYETLLGKKAEAADAWL